jgi:isoleucyl-tRNA synthetase
MKYPELPASLLELEDQILRRWRDDDLFRQTLDATADMQPFVFYEGPPTANGRPGLHHILSRTIKDLVCRHQTMLGRSVTRIAGWDTHGLPVEIEAEKSLGISGKPEIERVGIAEFNRACRESVFTYKEEWERLSERIGFWLDYSNPYVTYHSDYIESVWWVLKRMAERGLLYKGHKSVPFCPRCGTGLSSHEVAQGYRDVSDPSLFVTMEILDGSGREALVWTTTPWTLVCNTALAIHPRLHYVEVAHDGRRLVMARDRVEALFGGAAEIVSDVSAEELIGKRYARPLDLIAEERGGDRAWRIIPGEFVSAEEGSGIVHIAPAFGADDYQAGLDHGLPLLNEVRDDGTFNPQLDLVGGIFVKDADPLIVEELKRRGVLFRYSEAIHSYPHCWRCHSPLIYMARDSWFAATSSIKDEMLANNAQVHWFPPDVGEGRFGEWLANNVDWALSRDRYWGTPLPVWICDRDPDRVEWIGSFRELEERVGELPEDFDPHRPFIDELSWPCPDCHGTMRRAPEVVDVWFDSGAMPYAQWHYPFENEGEFETHFPADFICEGLDQTRGWFYSLMAIGSMLGLGPAYRNVVVNGLVLDAEGLKMSKSRGNVVNPWDAIEDHGSDALRWHLLTVSNPGVSKRYDSAAVGEAYRRFFDTLFNTYRFFALYANIEDWRPSEADPPPEERSVLDRWVLSRLDVLVREVRSELKDYQITRAYRQVGDFLCESLSNWYVRRSRPRFWGNTDEADSRAAFRTLHDALRILSLLIAPATPFVADWLHRALTGESVHLARFPDAQGLEDPDLDAEMEAARTLSTLGRAAREDVQIPVRQPLRRLLAVIPAKGEMRSEVLRILRDEINVKEVEFLASAEPLVHLVARPNYRDLGPRFQKRTEAAAEAIRGLSQEKLAAFRAGHEVSIEIDGESQTLQAGDLEVTQEAVGELVVRGEGSFTAALDPALDAELRTEGLARELVNRIQRLRRDSGLEVTDRIRLGIFGTPEVQRAADTHRGLIAGETLAIEMDVGPAPPSDGYPFLRSLEIAGYPAHVALGVAERP